jgi:hypothetical protein
MRANIPRVAQTSAVMLSTWCEDQDPRFLDALRGCSDDRALAQLAVNLTRDRRPWVRQQVLAYLALPMDRPGHHPLVKRLFKHAEANDDRELMAAFMTAFDRLVRRKVVQRRVWDSAVNDVITEETLELQRGGLFPLHAAKHPAAPPVRRQRGGTTGKPLFSLATRLYLRRRAWRFFRRLGYRDPSAYRTAVVIALQRYTDADVESGHDLLENWGLVHALFGRSPVLERRGTWIGLAEGRSLSELTTVPMFATTWRASEAFASVLSLAIDAQSKLVRTWAQDWLSNEHAAALRELPFTEVRRLLSATWPDVRVFGCTIFANHPQTPQLTLDDWYALLSAADTDVLQRICDAMHRHVHQSRLTPAAVVRLACHRSPIVCRLALPWFSLVSWNDDAAQSALDGMSGVTCVTLAEELGRRYLALRLGEQRHAADSVLRCLDHRLEGMRSAGMAWVDRHETAQGDELLWTRLAETPYDDVRAWMVRALERFAGKAHVAATQEHHLWASVLLGIHRGGREKLSAVRQLTGALRAGRDADTLLAILAIALRSLRRTEQAAALSAVVQAVVAYPTLLPVVRQRLPELDLTHLAQEAC